jgi:predicted phage tail protein
MLFSAPKPQNIDRPANKPSYAFDGAVNTAAQGNPVPICYGRLIVGSQVVSAGLVTEPLPA